MHLHHDKHHAAYIDNLNKALDKYPQLQKKDIVDLLKSDLPSDIKQAVTNHGGGHFNHSFFWEVMRPATGKQDDMNDELRETINSSFGNFDKFKEVFTAKALSVFGSGWAWVLLTPEKKLILKRHSFQNPPLANENIPLLGIDVWEHAYYLKYQNRRAEYIEAWFNVVNWDKVYEHYSITK
jgi:Fe-Mn family superoxide dismutase